MAQDRTSGFDMLVQISENELNDQIATAFLAGNMFPSSFSIPINSSGITATADLNFNTPVADLDQTSPRMGITIPFANSQLVITAPVALIISPLGGSITIVDTIEVITQGSSQIVTMDFASGAPTVTVDFDAASEILLAPLLTAASMTQDQAENMVAGVVLTELQTSIGRMDLTPAIPVVDDTDATTIFDMDVTTVNDTTALDRDCITFGIRTSSSSGGNINLATENFIPTGSDSLVMMSNLWLLGSVMRPRIAASLGVDVSNFDTPLNLNNNIAAPGGQGTLTMLRAEVVGNRIRVEGRATDSGTGWSAVSNFSFFISIALSGGAITVTATTPDVDTDVDLAWWVWLLSLGLGALFGGIIGIIIAAIVLAVVEAVAGGIVDDLIGTGISGSLGALPPVPLGPIGGGITIDNILLDDLELRSSIIRSSSVPIKNQGSHSSLSRFSVDIDTGAYSSGGVVSGADLIWDPSLGISTSGAAGLTVVGRSYESITPVFISRLPLSGNTIPLANIPISIYASFPFLPHDEIVFGVHTSDGRYAKARAYRDISKGFELQLDWVTYDTPTPTLDIAANWSITEEGKGATEYISKEGYCKSTPVSRKGIFEAWPRLMAFPVDYQWCLCGQVLEEGEGQVNSLSGPILYNLSGRRLTIETEMEQSVDCELCVSAIDARGQELFTCIPLSEAGTETECKPGPRFDKDYRVEFIHPLDLVSTKWSPLIKPIYRNPNETPLVGEHLYDKQVSIKPLSRK
ncbi:MAG: hypothetical protein V3T30_01720 [Thermodesulfobacteriota bacterium]